MQDNELTIVEELANAAAKGPWASVLDDKGVYVEDADEKVLARDLATEADALFIISARTDVPLLVAELRAAKKKLKTVANLAENFRRGGDMAIGEAVVADELEAILNA